MAEFLAPINFDLDSEIHSYSILVAQAYVNRVMTRVMGEMIEVIQGSNKDLGIVDATPKSRERLAIEDKVVSFVDRIIYDMSFITLSGANMLPNDEIPEMTPLLREYYSQLPSSQKYIVLNKISKELRSVLAKMFENVENVS